MDASTRNLGLTGLVVILLGAGLLLTFVMLSRQDDSVVTSSTTIEELGDQTDSRESDVLNLGEGLPTTIPQGQTGETPGAKTPALATDGVGPRGDVSGYETVVGPISLKAGETLSNKIVSNPNGNCVEIDGQNGDTITIEDTVIGPCGDSGIRIDSSSNVRIDFSSLKDIATIPSPEKGNDKAAVYVTRAAKDIYIGSSTINEIQDHFPDNSLGEHRAIFMSANVGGKAQTSNITIENIVAKNVGRNFVQIVDYKGPNIKVANNRIENTLGSTSVEDFINFCGSSGTADSPILIEGNYIRDGGPSVSGTGMILGDCAENESNYQTARNNVLVNPGQVGIGIYGGIGHTVENNVIYAEQNSWTNVGIYVWDPHNGDCRDIKVAGNQVNWINGSNRSGNIPGTPSHYWNAENCGAVAGEDTNTFGADIGPEIWNS